MDQDLFSMDQESPIVLDTLQGALGAHNSPAQYTDSTELRSPHLGALESYFSATPATPVIPTVAIPSSESPRDLSSLATPSLPSSSPSASRASELAPLFPP
jgi:hypothetical protein